MSRRALVRRVALALGLAAVGLGLRAAPADERRMKLWRFDIEVGGKITEVIPVDLDGDQRKDLLVVRGREALVYLQGKDASWPAEPNQRFRFHPTTVLFDVVDLEGDGKAEVVLLQPDGLSAYRLQERGGRLLFGLRPERVALCPTFLDRPIEDEVRRKALFVDVDQDGDPDAIIPQQAGFAILPNAGRGPDGKAVFAGARALPAPPTAALNVGEDRLSSQLFASYWFPNPNVVDWDASAPAEVVLADEGVLRVFRKDATGLPLEAAGAFTIPDQRSFTMNVESPFELDFTAPLVLRDLDRDGRVDASSTHVGQGITRVFRNGPDPAKAFATPVQSIRAKGVTFLSFYLDLDGDGLDDLVLPRMDKIGVWSIVKVLVTRSVPVDAQIYYQRKGGATLYPDEPDAVRQLEIPVGLHSGGEGGLKVGTTLVATLDGDLDGDGKKDLVYRTDDDKVGVFAGLQRGIATSPMTEAEIPSVDDYRFCMPMVTDLDGDGRSDLILRYFSWERDGDRLTILRSVR